MWAAAIETSTLIEINKVVNAALWRSSESQCKGSKLCDSGTSFAAPGRYQSFDIRDRPLCHTSAMESPAPPAMLQHLWKSALLSGILATILGIVVLAWPGKTIVVAAIFFGAYLLITGIVQVIFAFSLHVSAGGRVLLFISGAAALILAVLCFRSLLESILLLAIWIGVGFIFRGVATAVSAISDPTLPGRAWEIFIGVISLVAGVVMLASPFESIETLTLVVGIWLIVIGVFEAFSAFGIRKAGNDLTELGEKPAPPPTEEAVR
jgi:uncharacterized membrane protein HdeD (DUF308 family)